MSTGGGTTGVSGDDWKAGGGGGGGPIGSGRLGKPILGSTGVVCCSCARPEQTMFNNKLETVNQ